MKVHHSLRLYNKYHNEFTLTDQGNRYWLVAEYNL